MKIANVAIVGRANVGKSTLMNALVKEKVAIVSSKPQTTRTNVIGIYTNNDYQLVFIDTPGIHDPKNKLGTKMVKAASDALGDIDVAVLVTECRKPGKPEIMICDRLKKAEIPAILVINKIDLVAKDDILPVIAAYSEIFNFASIIPASALKNESVYIVCDEILKFAEEGEPLFPDDISTNMTMRDISSEIIREKFLNQLHDEIPHGIAVEIIAFKETKTKAGLPICEISVDIICERSSHKAIIIGKDGAMLKKAVATARIELEEIFGQKVYLNCFVKVRENWRDNDEFIKNLGL